MKKDPLEDYSVVGAYFIEGGAKNFVQWSKEMMEEFGPLIEPDLEEIYKISLIGLSVHKTLRNNEPKKENHFKVDHPKPVRNKIALMGALLVLLFVALTIQLLVGQVGRYELFEGPAGQIFCIDTRTGQTKIVSSPQSLLGQNGFATQLGKPFGEMEGQPNK